MQAAHLTWFILTVDLGRFLFLSALALSCMEAGSTRRGTAVNGHSDDSHARKQSYNYVFDKVDAFSFMVNIALISI